MNRLSRLLVSLSLISAAGCSSYGTYRDAQNAEQVEDWDQAVLYYLELIREEPQDLSYRAALMRAKSHASQFHFDLGKRFHEAGALERALIEYRQAVELDPTNQYAYSQLSKVRDEIEARDQNRGEVKTLAEMKREAQERASPPLLSPRSKEPISLNFPNAVEIKDIYRALGKAYGINVLFDPNLKGSKIAIELTDVTAQDALEILMRAAQHFYKVLDEHTILIVADTPQNRRAYEDLVIRTFFLSNAETKDIMTMLRTLVDAKKIAINEQLNAIVIRDSVDRVRVAERIINANDKAKAEVVVDVELLLINSSKIRELGLSLSNYSLGFGVDSGNENGSLAVSDLEFLNQNNWLVTVPSFIVNFIKSDADAQVLARPQLRITEGEKASLHIGDRVPIPTTTFNTANTIGGNIIPVTSFQYTDIGIKIDVEPRVHHNLEISLKVKVEVSNLAGSVEGTGGVAQPIIGTRNIDTVIRLKDGETNFLAGLLRTDEISGETGIPGLSDIPVIGRLFKNRETQFQSTDVILTLTPHIIRKSDITEEDLMPIWVGTESNITFRGGSPRVESDVEGPFDEGSSAAERVRNLIRQRVQELPRGLQNPAAEEGNPGVGGESEPSPGINLVPGSGPTDIFHNEPEEEHPDVAGGAAVLDWLAPSRRTGLGRLAFASAVDATLAPVRLRLAPHRQVVEPGERFQVRLEVEADLDVSHLPAALVYDARVLEVVAWRSGDFMGESDEAEVLAAETEPGRLVVGASRLGRRPGVRGRGTVVTVTFQAVAEGASRVELERARALDLDLREVGPVRSVGALVLVLDDAAEWLERPDRNRGAGRDL